MSLRDVSREGTEGREKISQEETLVIHRPSAASVSKAEPLRGLDLGATPGGLPDLRPAPGAPPPLIRWRLLPPQAASATRWPRLTDPVVVPFEILPGEEGKAGLARCEVTGPVDPGLSRHGGPLDAVR